MNKDRRTYAPQDEDDFSDVRENPYRCPKGRDIEALIEHGDRLRDEQKDHKWEAAIDRAEARRKETLP